MGQARLKAFVHIRSFRAECNFSTWLIGIVINESRLKLRKEHRYLYEWVDDHRSREEGHSWPNDYPDCRELPSAVLERKELGQALRRALNSLAAKYREVLVLRYLQQMSVAETAAALGLTQENVRTRSLRARSQMRRALAPTAIGVNAKEKTGDAGARCGRAPRSPSCPDGLNKQQALLEELETLTPTQRAHRLIQLQDRLVTPSRMKTISNAAYDLLADEFTTALELDQFAG